jgi:hypothetical protein
LRRKSEENQLHFQEKLVYFLQFDWGADIDAATNNVRDIWNLPRGAAQ